MPNKSGPLPGPSKTITFRRDGKGALKFSGQRIGSAVRVKWRYDDEDNAYENEIAVRLYKTTGGKYVLGFEVYNKTEEHYVCRDAEVAATLDELLAKCWPEKEQRK